MPKMWDFVSEKNIVPLHSENETCASLEGYDAFI